MTETKLWILRPAEHLLIGDDPWEPWYDKAFGFVVRAKTEKEARKLANKQGGGEVGQIYHGTHKRKVNPWINKKYTTCVVLHPNGETGVIIQDFAAA